MISMKKILPTLILASIIGIIFVSGCLGNSVKFKECKLDYSKIKEDQMTKMWVEIENNGEITKDIQVTFIYPKTLTIESKGKKTTGFNVTVDPNGATSGRKSFTVYGDYIEGQPSSPWDIEVKMYVDKELVGEKKLTLTILPP